MKRTAFLLFVTLLACEESGANVRKSGSTKPFQLAPATSSEDPEDVTCGVLCEPGSVRECGGIGPGVETCAPSGMGWSVCGYDGFPRAESICAKGTKCVIRPSGDLSLCEKECTVEVGGSGGAGGVEGGAGAGGEPPAPKEPPVCTKCKQERVYGGLMGCRAICKAEPGECAPGEGDEPREMVRCEAETPYRAAAAGCVVGPENGTYCCPGGSAILNPLFRCPECFR